MNLIKANLTYLLVMLALPLTWLTLVAGPSNQLNRVGASKELSVGDQAGVPALLLATEREIVKVAADGTIVWKREHGLARDVQSLADGNILFPFNIQVEGEKTCGVREINPQGRTVWEYTMPGEYVISCQRLQDGNTLVGASCLGAVLIVSPEHEVLHSIKVRGKHKKHSTTIVRQLSTGHILVVEEDVKYVTEYTLDGKIVWEYKMPFPPFCAERLSNGNTMISGKGGLIEVSPAKEVVWQLTSADVEAMGPRWFAGFCIRPNGNIVIANPGGVVPVYEVNRAKQVVWHSRLTKENLDPAHGLALLP